ncbi:glutamine--fructose-6-phosphate transaminase (isomerizing) [Alkalibacter rhizosphaerae]|uniref:Glutamine--fructose-6-phosphate aminotransferase [isomerizing] n=1 Tax=Alkalibacter rhizosphaerae TaxID=2815577 RepID=A0A974XLH7_9FIRM|nr:glutamine--fructose-6-phosphate transaminase (isomerizing) [Alkalibacter rhizosphaerae]QSX08161.1 glutamine--fructose-6-phosphate transaminase (isomerizing) [Alkalibacter rhizosphaerae]
MCGIVGYIGEKQAAPILVEGLKKLEYRGYDSAGVAIYDMEKIHIRKKKGRLAMLEEEVTKNEAKGVLGIGHTRWATHGAPSDINSHPHCNGDCSISIVHNGIIENYMDLKEGLIEKGYIFHSETDTEVIAHLIDDLYDTDLLSAVQAAVKMLKGSYALGVISSKEPDKIIAVRKDSPLVVGLGERENFIASDIPAILNHTRRVYLLDDNEVAVLTKDGVKVLDKYGEECGKQVFKVDWDAADAEKGGYDYFMHKEIHEQPKALRDTMTSRISSENDDIVLDQIKLGKDEMEKINKVYIVACGTAYHAGLIGKFAIEKYARIPVEAEIASEFRYRNPIVDEKTLLIVLSQSGETADTLAAMRLVRERGGRVMAITNVIGSTVSREADDVMYTWAGPEIAVASTKAYTTQLACMYMIAIHLGLLKETITKEYADRIRLALLKAPEEIEYVIKQEERIKEFAYKHFKVEDMFFLGRGLDNYVAMEGSLKMKEISYIHSEAYPAGELKHGTIALVVDDTVIIALCTQEELFEKMLSNIKEVKARGAYIMAIAQEKNKSIEREADEVFYIKDTEDDVASIATVVYLQILAYYLSVARGCDVDKPRNLAKSVTVE